MEPTALSLCVGIPTYKREAALLRRLGELDGCRSQVSDIVILDNDPLSQVGERLAREKLPETVRYFRNRANVGACANILKVLEAARGTHLWFRGDDDRITPHVVETVHGKLGEGFDIVIFTSLDCGFHSGQGLGDFCANPWVIRSARWVSAVTVPIDRALAAVDCGYYGVPFGWPHITLLVGILKKFPTTRWCLVSLPDAVDGFRDIGREEGMKYAYFRTGLQLFPRTAEIIEEPAARRAFLANARKAFGPRTVRTAVRLRLGYMAEEKIGWATVSSLVSWRDPRSTLLGLTLYALGVTPRWAIRAAACVAFAFLPDQRKEGFGFGFLKGVGSPLTSYRLLKANAQKDRALCIY